MQTPLNTLLAGHFEPCKVERATTVTGPYFPVATNLTAQSFLDVGALPKQTQLYYRLRQQQ